MIPRTDGPPPEKGAAPTGEVGATGEADRQVTDTTDGTTPPAESHDLALVDAARRLLRLVWGLASIAEIADAVGAAHEHVDRMIYLRAEMAEIVAADEAAATMERWAAEVSP